MGWKKKDDLTEECRPAFRNRRCNWCAFDPTFQYIRSVRWLGGGRNSAIGHFPPFPTSASEFQWVPVVTKSVTSELYVILTVVSSFLSYSRLAFCITRSCQLLEKKKERLQFDQSQSAPLQSDIPSGYTLSKNDSLLSLIVNACINLFQIEKFSSGISVFHLRHGSYHAGK